MHAGVPAIAVVVVGVDAVAGAVVVAVPGDEVLRPAAAVVVELLPEPAQAASAEAVATSAPASMILRFIA
jgi:hypothetical protein